MIVPAAPRLRGSHICSVGYTHLPEHRCSVRRQIAARVHELGTGCVEITWNARVRLRRPAGVHRFVDWTNGGIYRGHPLPGQLAHCDTRKFVCRRLHEVPVNLTRCSASTVAVRTVVAYVPTSRTAAPQFIIAPGEHIRHRTVRAGRRHRVVDGLEYARLESGCFGPQIAS